MVIAQGSDFLDINPKAHATNEKNKQILFASN